MHSPFLPVYKRQWAIETISVSSGLLASTTKAPFTCKSFRLWNGSLLCFTSTDANHELWKLNFFPSSTDISNIYCFQPNRWLCYGAEIHEHAHTKHPLNQFSLDGKTIFLLLIILTDINTAALKNKKLFNSWKEEDKLSNRSEGDFLESFRIIFVSLLREQSLQKLTGYPHSISPACGSTERV